MFALGLGRAVRVEEGGGIFLRSRARARRLEMGWVRFVVSRVVGAGLLLLLLVLVRLDRALVLGLQVVLSSADLLLEVVLVLVLVQARKTTARDGVAAEAEVWIPR